MRRNEWGIYDSPLWRDWLVYLTVVGVWAGVIMPESRATVFDLAVAVLVQFVLFGLLPGLVRVWVRQRRRVH